MGLKKYENKNIMTLKEQLRQRLTGHLSDEKTEVDVNIAEQIADEFAIGFAEWLTDNRVHFIKWINAGITTKDLLEIYKKEKGL